MTSTSTIDEAQVEAAAKAMYESQRDFHRSWSAWEALPADTEHSARTTWLRLARAALTATAQAGPEKTVDTTKLNAGQLVQRIMRVMDRGDAGSGGGAKLAEEIAAGILDLPADYWHKPAPAPLGRADDEWVLVPKAKLQFWIDVFLQAETKFALGDGQRFKNIINNARHELTAMLAAAPAPPVQSGEGRTIGELYYDIQNLLGQFMANDTDLMSAMSTIYPTIEARIAILTQALAPFIEAGLILADHVSDLPPDLPAGLTVEDFQRAVATRGTP